MDTVSDHKREALLAVAWDVFSEYGYARGQVSLISERSHVSTATIYKLYPGKEQLFVAAYTYALQQFRHLTDAAHAIDDPVESLRAMARTYAEVLNRRSTRQLLRQQIAQNVSAAGLGRATGNAVREQVEGLFIPILERCAAAGLIDPACVHRAHALIAGFIEHQTLIFGLVIDETKTAQFSGDPLADDAVRAALLTYAPG
jgi:AcrR family transcriptional regulator